MGSVASWRIFLLNMILAVEKGTLAQGYPANEAESSAACTNDWILENKLGSWQECVL